jgi:hypothetical protein
MMKHDQGGFSVSKGYVGQGPTKKE